MTFQEKTCIILNRVKESKLCINISLLAAFIFLNLKFKILINDIMIAWRLQIVLTFPHMHIMSVQEENHTKGWINGNISVHNELILSWDNYKSGDRMTDGQTDREREGRFEHTCQPGPPGESCCSSHMACHH